MKLIIGGALGRMGHEITKAAEATGNEIVCGVDVRYAGQPSAFPIVTAYDRVTVEADVLIDFSRPDALPELLVLARGRRMPAVLCATGYTDTELNAIAEAVKEIPILRSANMSLGVNVMLGLVRMAAKALGDGFDVEIIERHHRMKEDSPSGTALMLYNQVQAVRGEETEPIYGRYARSRKRAPQEIGIHAVRGGTLTGEHEVSFYGDGEQLTLLHRAENRSLFAQGALKAARFLMDKPAGMYDMQSVVTEMLKMQ